MESRSGNWGSASIEARARSRISCPTFGSCWPPRRSVPAPADQRQARRRSRPQPAGLPGLCGTRCRDWRVVKSCSIFTTRCLRPLRRSFPRLLSFTRLLCLEERLSAAIAHKVICVNHPQRATLVARGIPDAKTFVSMNVPDPRIFGSHSANGHVPDPARLNLVYHGTMAERLGVDLLIRAVAQLRDRVPTAATPFVGSRRRPCRLSAPGATARHGREHCHSTPRAFP